MGDGMVENDKKNIHVFVNRRKIEFSVDQVTGRQLLETAEFTGTGWDLLQLQGEGDPTGGTLIMADQTIALTNGQHFRVIPGNRTFGA
jgi:hypothetical protein